MNPERWRQIKDIFTGALEKSPEERDSWITAAAAGDDTLRREVMSLLVANEGPQHYIDTPIMERAMRFNAPATARANWIGQTIDRYRIVEEIGRGGMGVVFKAVRVDKHFEQHVAIKLLQHSYDTDALLSRFRSERQILARLSHPNIAHLFDGGSTESGLPYLVMEYVRGEPIDEYCERKKLNLRERLRIFRTLCDAVHYVHRHLMVHGDLKCGNVLVTEERVVKLLDFGIAKLLDTSPTPGVTQLRLTGAIGLTPEYASPEQIRGEPVTTASDVYSLGVLLYKLLTLQTPYVTLSGGYYDMARQICEGAPRRPSVAVVDGDANAPTTAQELRGDLDTIVLKALQKAPDERYTSVEQFSEDIGRYLDGFPVMAVPESTGYRVRKFVGRNRPLVIAGTLAVISLVIGIFTTSWQAHIARQERERAQRHFEDVHQFAQTLLLEVHDSISALPGTKQARERIISNTLKYLDGLLRESEDNPEVRRDLARAYERVSDLQGGLQGMNVEMTRESARSLLKAIHLLDGLWQDGVRDQELARDRFRLHNTLSQRLLSISDVTGAELHAELALARATELVKRSDATIEDHRLLANAYTVEGTLKGLTGSLDVGIERLRAAQAIYEKYIDFGDTSVAMRRSYAIATSRIGKLLAMPGRRFAEAYQVHLKAFGIAESLLAEDPLNSNVRALKAYEQMNLAAVALRMGNAPESLRRWRQSVEDLRSLSDADSGDEEMHYDLALGLAGLSDALRETGHFEEAQRVLAESQAELHRLPRSDSAELNSAQLLLAENDLRLGKLHLARVSQLKTTVAERQDLMLQGCALLRQGSRVLSNVPEASVQKLSAQDQLELAAEAMLACEQTT